MQKAKAPLIAKVVFGILGLGMFMTARQIERGVRREYHGRRAGSKQALAALAEALGPTGSLIVWLGGTAVSGAWLALTIRKQGKSADGASPDANSETASGPDPDAQQ